MSAPSPALPDKYADCLCCDGSGDVLILTLGGYNPTEGRAVTCDACNGSGLSTETVEQREAYDAYCREAEALEQACRLSLVGPYTGGGYGGSSL